MDFFRRLFGAEWQPAQRTPAPNAIVAPEAEDATRNALSALLRCARNDNLSPNDDLQTAIRELRRAAEDGANMLATFLDEMLTCRSAEITWALAAAKACAATDSLVTVVRRVVAAPELVAAPVAPRFLPEIIGGGRVGWSTGTTMRVRRLAQETLDVLVPRERNSVSQDGEGAPVEPDVRELLNAVKAFARGQEHATTVEAIGKRVGSKAAFHLHHLIESDGSGPMALAVVYCVRSWQPAETVALIRHALTSRYPGAEYYAALYLRANPTAEAKELARECAAGVKDDDARRALREMV